MITEKCNCDCFFCSRKNLNKRIVDANIDDYHSAIDILSRAYPSSKLVLSGGEPTLSKNLFPILQFAPNRFEKIEIQTNGAFDEIIANKLKPFLEDRVYLQFSVDGMRDTHDAIRGIGVFDKVITNLERLKDYSSHLSISATVTPSNINDVLEFASFLNNLKMRRFTVSYVQPLHPKDELMISNVTWNNFVDRLLMLCNYRVDVSKLYDFRLMDKCLEKRQNWHGVTNCGRGITHFYVTSNFDVLPCTCTEETVGNLFRDDISIIKKRLSQKERVSVDILSACHSCPYLSICNGGCPGLSKKVFGVENMGDIRCPIVAKYAKEKGLITEGHLI